MKNLKAVLVKDLRLFRSGAGLLCLILPLILLLALQAGSGDLLQEAYLEPFPIALRDEDGTLMSRSLTSQMKDIELFSEVRDAGTASDRELLDGGCAAVVTLPKDFFYTMYTMDNGLVEVVLNENMPMEASVFQSVLGAVMEIIDSDQAVSRAVYRFSYGDLTEEQKDQLWEENSEFLIADALGRQKIFDGAAEASDRAGAVQRGLFACCLSVICLFFPLTAVKTLPEELNSGVLPRYLAAGGKISIFYFSKFLVSAALTLPSLLLVTFAFQQEHRGLTMLLAAVLFFGAFGFFLMLAAWTGKADSAQRWGNLVLLISLIFGGALYAGELLPGPVQALGRLTLPFYARRGLESIHHGTDALALLLSLWPVWTGGIVFTGLSLPLMGRQSRQQTALKPAEEKKQEEKQVLGHPGRLRILGWKFRAMSGSRAGLAVLLLTALVCGGIARYALGGNGPQALHLAVSLESDGPLAAQLADCLEHQEGVAVRRTDSETGRELLRKGAAEGLLIIGKSYDEALLRGDSPELHYESAAPAVSAQAAREIIAGQAAAQKARTRGLGLAEEKLGRPLTEQEKETLWQNMLREQEQAPELFRVRSADGKPVKIQDPFAPGLAGFAALAVMLTQLTWAAWTGRPDVRRVEKRMLSFPGGRWLSYGTDAGALLLVGLMTGLLCMLPGGPVPWTGALGLLFYVFCVTGAALALTRRTALAGRMDVLAPFLALITCLAGGCFGSLSQFSPVLKFVSLLTPQGLLLRAQAGVCWPVPVLAAAGTVLFLLGAPRKRELE